MSDTEAAMNKFLDDGGWTFPVMMCPDAVAMAYEVQAVPTLFVLDSEGRVVERLVGGASASEISDLIDGL